MRILKVTRLPRNLDAQVELTVREMIRICRCEVWNADVRWLLHNVRLPHFNTRETAIAATHFIREKFPFELDPEEVELVRTPSYYARSYRARRPASGDCDDFALLLATLFGAMGISELGFVVMARRPGEREPYGHVFVAARIDGGKLEYFDPSVSRIYSTDGLRRKTYPIPSSGFPPRI